MSFARHDDKKLVLVHMCTQKSTLSALPLYPCMPTEPKRRRARNGHWAGSAHIFFSIKKIFILFFLCIIMGCSAHEIFFSGHNFCMILYHASIISLYKPCRKLFVEFPVPRQPLTFNYFRRSCGRMGKRVNKMAAN